MEKVRIIFENEDYLVIDKPAGMVTNRAESVDGETVQDWADKKLSIKEGTFLGEEGDLFKKRSGIAHRLDKETSGCLIIAKHPKALIAVLGQFKDRKISKEYLALVHGRLEPAEGVIKLPMQRSRYDRERFEVHYGGKTAETSWRVEEYLEKEGRGYSLVRLFPKTGRTHQIRVHLAHMGHPLFSDERYLRKDWRLLDREKLAFHFLHAVKIVFQGLAGEEIVVETKEPDEAEKLLSWMRNG